MKVLVVSGFLGAGKTTFIKELIRRTGEQLVILENEYGENDIDSRELSNTGVDAGAGKLEILEFMEGCVCCTQKDTFSNTILSISASLDPEYLVVEPTGVGKLSNILGNIERVSWEKITLLRPVVVLTPRSLISNLRDFPEICTDQISHAQVVVFSKAEREDSNVVADAIRRVREINPDAEIISSHYSGQDDAWWKNLLLLPGEAPTADDASGTDAAAGSGVAGDSQMEQVTLKDASLDSLAELIMLLEDALRFEFGVLPRAKGVIQVGQEWLRFDLADGLYGIISAEDSARETQCVFIGKHLDEDHLRARLNCAPREITQATPDLASFRPAGTDATAKKSLRLS